MTEPETIKRHGRRTAAEILADWDATVAPDYLGEETPQARAYDLAFADYYDRVAGLLVEVVRLPAADRPEAIVKWVLNRTIAKAREAATSRRERHADEHDDDQAAQLSEITREETSP
jgi:hypothetical protein